MKTRFLSIFLLCITGLLLMTCKKSSDDTTTTPKTYPWQSTQYTAGQVLTYSLVKDGDTLVKMKDIAVDYGYSGFPVILLVHKETPIIKAGWGSVFLPLKKERLDSVLVLWSNEFGLGYATAHDKAVTARHFVDYMVKNKLDAALFVDLVLGSAGMKMAPLLEIVSLSEKIHKAPNNQLYRVFSEKIPPEQLLGELKSTQQTIAIVSICLHVFMTAETWIKFVNENKPVANAPSNYASFLCSADTTVAYYIQGTPFRTKDYTLSYDAGLWEAKCTYHLEGVYNAITGACPGKYIPSCNTLSTYVHVKGTGFIVDGSVGYSPAINVGSFEVPVAEMNGKVSVTYGDCCCFRKFSYLNFKMNAESGYTETSFDPGKN